MALPESYTIGVIYEGDTVYLYDAQPDRMSYIVLLQNVMFERFKDTDYIELNLVRRQGEPSVVMPNVFYSQVADIMSLHNENLQPNREVPCNGVGEAESNIGSQTEISGDV
ncbi:hypothetical protein JCGZ_24329 [Jatropha curcas]|uniref:Uncharacterized protein n=1 Tax=Jatropha curcas TaxID=180498 RepID=A0A067LDH9_JATCU|nr:hypothetical protein JCGZ_24329 [Jatropha curcas]